MTHLIPQVRVNKNGVPVTKHVLADTKPNGVKGSIPSPALRPSPKKPLKLLPRQKEVQHQVMDRTTFRPSEELLKALPFQYAGKTKKYDISDEYAYELLSVMRVNDAVHLIHFGHRNKDTALEFLENEGLSSLVQDNSEMMQEALARRIPAPRFIELHGLYGVNGHPRGNFLDAAEALSSGTLRSLNGPDAVNDIHLKVLVGDLSLADIKAVGISRIHKSNAAHSVLNALQSMKAGTLDCTVDDIRILIDKNDSEGNTSVPLKWALESIPRYGADFLVGTSRLMIASRIAEQLKEKRVPVPEIKELITYEGIMRSFKASLSFTDLKKLRNAGVPAEAAGKIYDGRGGSVEYIISAHQNGISLPVTEGWL